MKGILIKYLTQKNRNIISIFIIILGVLFMYNYMFNSPTYINKYIATKIYKEPANNAFTDQNFYNCVINAYNRTNNANKDYTDSLSDEELATITSIECQGKNLDDSEKIISVEGIKKLTNLTIIKLSDNKISSIDVSNRPILTELEINNNQLTALNLNNDTELIHLYASSNQLQILDVSTNIKLSVLKVNSNKLESLNINNNPQISILEVQYNQLTALDISNNLELWDIDVDGNNLTTLDVNNNLKLQSIDAAYNQLVSLDISNNTILSWINVDNNNLTALDVSNNLEVWNINVGSNNLTTLDISNNLKLKRLNVEENQLQELNISNNLKLNELNVINNKLNILDVSSNINLNRLKVYGNQLTTLDLSNNSKLEYLLIGEENLINDIIMYKNSTVNVIDYALRLPEGGTNEISSLHGNSNDYIERNGGIKNIAAGRYLIDKIRFKHNYATNTIERAYDMKFDLYVLEATSDKYIIDEENNSIYIGIDNNNTSIINNINLNYGIGSIENNKYIIKYNDKIIKEFNLVNLVSNKYDLSKDYIYVGFDDVSNLTNDISCANCEVSTSNNMLEVRYNNIKADEYPIVRLNTEYERRKNIIFVLDDYGNNETILNKITCTNGNLSIEDNKLIVKNNDEVIDEYKLYSENKYIDSDEYLFDDEKMVAYNVDNKLLISELINITESSGQLQILDKNGEIIADDGKLKTGYTLRATFNQDPTNKLDYRLSVRGDVLGEGKISIEGTKKVMRHIIDGNVITGDEYLYAADYDSNGLIKMNDVTRMLMEKNQ